MNLNAFDIEQLYRLADDVQRDGDFTGATNLRELLDSRATLLKAQNELAEADLPDEPGDVVTACKKLGAAFLVLDTDNCEHVVEACDSHDALKFALELAADEVNKEAGNVGDTIGSIEDEIEKLRKLIPGLIPVGGFPQQVKAVVAALEDAVSCLEAQRNRLKETAKRAREAHERAKP